MDNHLIFGIDLGIASCGWAVLKKYPSSANIDAKLDIIALGSWCFEPPEEAKTRTPKNQTRRANRLLRRVIRRRRNRIKEIKSLFNQMKLIDLTKSDYLVAQKDSLDPWELRFKGLDKALNPKEFALTLLHIAKRRGFKSAAKTKTNNASDDDKKMLAALNKTKEKLTCYRTIGEMYTIDPEFSQRRRNRNGLFDRTADREDLYNEVTKLFSAQRRLQQNFATQDLEEQFKTIAFRQLKMQDSEKLVGNCPFEVEEKRSAKRAPSFELFKLLSRLNNLKLKNKNEEIALSPEQLALIIADFGKTAKISVKTIRRLLKINEEYSFSTIKKEDENKDIVIRSGEALAGSYSLRKALGETHWQSLLKQPETLDKIAHIFSFFNTLETIEQNLEKLNLVPEIFEALQIGLQNGNFDHFTGTGHISAKACRNILPFLKQGQTYDKACKNAGYNHTNSQLSYNQQILNKVQFNELSVELGENINNPIARKALTEGLKQLWAMRNQFGLPSAIHIELARDVGKSADERQKIKDGLDKNTAQREKDKKEAMEKLNATSCDDLTLLRYQLWKEQNGECPYSGKKINVLKIISTDNSIQIDHILPWSRFGDNSFHNKTLCLAVENQNKRGQTPYEWFKTSKTADEWDIFTQRIETNKNFKGFKKRNFLLKIAKEVEEKFRSRNLNDTRYAVRLLAEAAKLFYPVGERQEKGGIRRVFTRPGSLTSMVRRAWGLEHKKKEDGERIQDDRHHALDALIVAALSESEVQRLTKLAQENEQKGLPRLFTDVPLPCKDFRDNVLAAYETIRVARGERRRARGKGHDATIKQMRIRDGKEIVFERKDILKITKANLDRIKDKERNQAIILSLQNWLDNGSPKDQLPKSPNGDEIKKIRVKSKDKPAVPIRGGTADRGDMARVDVFKKPNKKNVVQWYLVPIYPHQIMNKQAWPHPPNKAITAHKDEQDWIEIDATFEFCFSLYPNSYIELSSKNGEVIEGYYGGVDRSTAAITVKNHFTRELCRPGSKTLKEIKKYNINRFGILSEIKGEKRTWHGAVCIFPILPD